MSQLMFVNSINIKNGQGWQRQIDETDTESAGNNNSQQGWYQLQKDAWYESKDDAR
jgi:hypothetical protein